METTVSVEDVTKFLDAARKDPNNVSPYGTFNMLRYAGIPTKFSSPDPQVMQSADEDTRKLTARVVGTVI